MSVFHQLKNIFRSSSHTNDDNHHRHQNKSNKYEAAVTRIVKEESIIKSKLPAHDGLSENYTLLKKLGEGAFSNVYKAIDIKSGQHVAVKIVRKFELTQAQKASVLKEAQIMRTLNHPSIIKMLDFIETKEHFFLVLELMEGGEIFHQIVQLTYFSEELSRHCIRQVGEAIRYLHEEKGVVHRDIKPENILFESIPFMERKTSPLPTQPEDDEPKEDEGEFVAGLGGGGIGKVKIADFGLSKVVWDKHTMTPCGTVGYTAPEIVRDERYSKSVDMFALGCVLYTMLCGFPPFYDESIATLTQKVAKGQYTFLSPWWDHISFDAKDLIQRLLEINPKKRYTIDQFLAHPWMSNQDTPIKPPTEDEAATVTMEKKEEEKEVTGNRERRNSPDLLVPPSTTTSVATETVSITPSSPRNIPKSSKRKDIYLSGLTSMKEVFDVSYAVHRMGEERAARKELKKLNANNNTTAKQRFKLFNAPLHDDEDNDVLDDDSSNNSSTSSASLSSSEQERQMDSLCKTLHTTKVEEKRKSSLGDNLLIKKLAGGLTPDGPPIVNRKVKKSFDLNLGNATLLGRRKNVPIQ